MKKKMIIYSEYMKNRVNNFEKLCDDFFDTLDLYPYCIHILFLPIIGFFYVREISIINLITALLKYQNNIFIRPLARRFCERNSIDTNYFLSMVLAGEQDCKSIGVWVKPITEESIRDAKHKARMKVGNEQFLYDLQYKTEILVSMTVGWKGFYDGNEVEIPYSEEALREVTYLYPFFLNSIYSHIESRKEFGKLANQNS